MHRITLRMDYLPWIARGPFDSFPEMRDSFDAC